MKIAIVGAGGVGCQAARHLAKEGHEVLLFEQFTLDHDLGSSYGESRIIRKTYADRLLTQLMGAAYPLWHALQDEAGESLFVQCGGLYFGREGHEELRLVEDALKANTVPYERLSAADTNARFPAFHLREGEYAIYQHESGFLRASACVRAAGRLAVKHGARLLERTTVTKVIPDGAGLKVESSAGAFGVDRVIYSAGPWTGALLAALKLPLRVSRQQYLYLKPRDAQAAAVFEPARCPVWIHAGSLSDGGEYYGFPSDGRVEGVKFAQHKVGPVVNPDAVERTFDPQLQADMLAYAAVRLPGLTREVAYSKTCLYTNTPETDFIVDAVPGLPGAFAVGGLSGHGYKFLVLLGRIAADLALGKKVPYDLSRFRIGRFAAGAEQ